MKNKKIALISFIVGTTLSLTSISVFAAQNFSNRSQECPPVYSVNENGLTYGSAANAVSVETEPDLISAVGIDGTEGYVYSKELQGEMPKTPEEAVKITKALNQKVQAVKSEDTVYVRKVPLYDISGEKVIGEFGIVVGQPYEKPVK